jgi:beta-mannosidase
MLRVWSSGASLSDEIYDLADEMVILLWSAFDFTESTMLVLLEFIENCEAEACYNVRRVNHHPSLAFWSGNNEQNIVDILWGLYPETILDNYEEVVTKVLVECAHANTSSIGYIPSSTYPRYSETPRYDEQSIYANIEFDTNDAANAFRDCPTPRLH